jgi:hypothetical protein
VKKYKVTLTAAERALLHDLISAGQAAATKLTHARILLKADAGPDGPAWTDGAIADAVEVDVIAPSKAWERRMRCKHSETFRWSPAGGKPVQ